MAEGEVAAFLTRRRPSVDLEPDDLKQQCLLHWWRRRDRHNPSRGASKKTFMATVVRAKLADIGRAVKAQRRGGASAVLSLDVPTTSYEEGLPLAETIGDPNPAMDPEKAAVRADLRAHIEGAAHLLTPRQRQLLDGLLRGYKITEISERLAVSRPTIHEDVKRIRKAFRDEGLHEFVD